MSHCRRELFQELMHLILLNEEFVNACREGLLICCSDGVVRRIFLRLMSYSADYPERYSCAHITELVTDLCFQGPPCNREEPWEGPMPRLRGKVE
jgi:hypothetical protein